MDLDVRQDGASGPSAKGAFTVFFPGGVNILFTLSP
jgi:hypothetical protein